MVLFPGLCWSSGQSCALSALLPIPNPRFASPSDPWPPQPHSFPSSRQVSAPLCPSHLPLHRNTTPLLSAYVSAPAVRDTAQVVSLSSPVGLASPPTAALSASLHLLTTPTCWHPTPPAVPMLPFTSPQNASPAHPPTRGGPYSRNLVMYSRLQRDQVRGTVSYRSCGDMMKGRFAMGSQSLPLPSC